MSVSRSQYRRLPGKRSGLLRRNTLWLGPDHLLRVNSTRFTERYRRFYFRDIQAICLQNGIGPNWRTHGMIAFAGALFVAGLFYSAHQIWAALLAIAIGVYVFAVWRRPDCSVTIQTAVGTNSLPSLCHIRPTRKAIALINERIYASQPRVTGEELALMMALPPPLPGAAQAMGGAPPPLPQAESASSSRLFIVSFAALLALGGIKLAEALTGVPALTWSLPAAYICTLGLFVGAIVRSGIRKLPRVAVVAVFAALTITGALGSASVRWTYGRVVLTMRNEQVERIYAGIAANTALQVTLSVVLLATAGVGLFAFVSEWDLAGAGDGPITLFGAERP